MVMAVVGVSAWAGQLTVLLFALVCTGFAFAWFRMRFSEGWAAAAAALLMFAPYLVYWGRDIMLEVPLLALVLGAMYYFERLLRADQPGWRDSLAWTLCTVLAIWTKQHALMLLGVFAMATLTTLRWKHLVRAPVAAGVVVVALSAVALVVVQVKLGGDAVGHSVGFTAEHVKDRFNWDQWKYYVRRFPEVLYWPVLAAAGFGLVHVVLRRPAYFSILLVWPAVFYVMHSYMKAQDIRYAIVVMPPVVALAVLGVRSLGFAAVEPRRTGAAARVGMACLLAYTGWGVLKVRVPEVSPSYRLAADELCARLAPFSCLTFVAERAARPAVMHRLVVEKRRSAERDIYSFGRILRASQVLRGGSGRWPDAAGVSVALKEWNVKYLLIESPSPFDPHSDDARIAGLLEELAAREFTAVAKYPVDLTAPRWPVRISRNDHPHRTLRLLERTEAMEFNPAADPPIRPKRVDLTIGGGG